MTFANVMTEGGNVNRSIKRRVQLAALARVMQHTVWSLDFYIGPGGDGGSNNLETMICAVIRGRVISCEHSRAMKM